MAVASAQAARPRSSVRRDGNLLGQRPALITFELGVAAPALVGLETASEHFADAGAAFPAPGNSAGRRRSHCSLPGQYAAHAQVGEEGFCLGL